MPADVSRILTESPAGETAGIARWSGITNGISHACCRWNQASQLKEGAELSVRLPFVLNQAIPVKVAATNKDKDGQVAVIFESSQMSKELSSIRNEQVQIQIKEYEGLRVPDTAMQFNDKQEAGVYGPGGERFGVPPGQCPVSQRA